MSSFEHRHCNECGRLERIIERLLNVIDKLLEKNSGVAVTAKGQIMPARILVGGKGATFTYTEFDSVGNIVKPKGPITFASDTQSVATVDGATQVVNPDGSVSVQVQAVAANADGSDANAVISGFDPLASTGGLAAADNLTVGASGTVGGAVSAKGVLVAN